jgi:hypothetical protein
MKAHVTIVCLCIITCMHVSNSVSAREKNPESGEIDAVEGVQTKENNASVTKKQMKAKPPENMANPRALTK